MRDVQDRQRSVVFPGTLANETRLWRNILNGSPTPLTWIGLAVLGIFVFGLLIVFLKMLNDTGGLWQGILETALIFGPIFGLIVWATRRNLRKLENSHHKSKTGRL
jgi:hypothetical protein